MIESTIINKLLADSTLTGMLATYNSSPAIFSDEAPENCESPLMVISISPSQSNNKPVAEISINVDVFDFNKSRSTVRQIMERVEFDLDDNKLTHERYHDIRIQWFSGPVAIPAEDPREIHYNSQFMARATRVKWGNETKV